MRGRRSGRSSARRLTRCCTAAESTWHENQLVPILRYGAVRDVYWTYSYGPIDEPTAPGAIGGVLVLCTETTQQVLDGKAAGGRGRAPGAAVRAGAHLHGGLAWSGARGRVGKSRLPPPGRRPARCTAAGLPRRCRKRWRRGTSSCSTRCTAPGSRSVPSSARYTLRSAAGRAGGRALHRLRLPAHQGS